MTTQQLLLGRQPILDRRGQTYAYELLFRGKSKTAASFADDVMATSQVLHHLFAELGVDKALGPYRGFINCDSRMLLMPEILEVLPPQRVGLEILETVESTPEIVARCRDLKSAGFQLALDDYIGPSHQHEALLALVDVIKVDLGQISPAALPAIVADAARWPGKLLAEKVESRAQASQCEALGFELFQGYYFARPTILAGRKLGLPERSLMHLLTLLLQDADSSLIEEVFKQQPGLSVNLLKLANSAAIAPPQPVASLGQAIAVLGRRDLQRWVQVLLYTQPGQAEVANPLLQLAATRGGLMERVADTLWHQRERADQAFMVGMMSLMPAVFSTPLAEILASVPLPAAVSEALGQGTGPLAELLERVTALEADPTDASLLPAGLDLDEFSASLAAAMAWANRIGQRSA